MMARMGGRLTHTLFGATFGLLLAVAGSVSAMVGGGHGTFIPLGTYGSPLSFFSGLPLAVGPVALWTVVGLLLPIDRGERSRRGQFVLLVHYLSAVLAWTGAGDPRLSDWRHLHSLYELIWVDAHRMLHPLWLAFVLGMVVYLGGQVWLWRRLMGRPVA